MAPWAAARLARWGAQNVQALYGGTHKRRRADESTIVAFGLDLAFYQRKTAELEVLGFRALCDFVDVNVEQSSLHCRSVVRVFLSGDGTAMCGVYHSRFGGWVRLFQMLRRQPRQEQIIGFETELSDGAFVTTSNGTQAGPTVEVPGVSEVALPAGVSTAELWAEHQAHLRHELDRRPAGASPLHLRTWDEVEAYADRRQLRECAVRNPAAFKPTAQTARCSDQRLSPA